MAGFKVGMTVAASTVSVKPLVFKDLLLGCRTIPNQPCLWRREQSSESDKKDISTRPKGFIASYSLMWALLHTLALLYFTGPK